MSSSKKSLSLEEKLDRFEAALAAERKERLAERKADKAKREADDAKREAERKADDAKREAERKADDAKREAERKADDAKWQAERRELAVALGGLSQNLGRLAEFAVESGILDTLKGCYDFDVEHILPKIDVEARGGEEDEFGEVDIIVSGKRDIVVVETKVTLDYNDVTRFVTKYLRNFPRWQASSPHIILPDCEGKRIFGCAAYAQASSNAEDAAVKAGLITVHIFGSSSKIAHPDTKLVDFQPNP